MEQNNEMSAQQSLQIITETFNKSRKGILRNSAKYFLLWGALLTAISLVIYLLWNLTGKPQWNFLWFAMPAIGYPLAFLLGKKDEAIPNNLVGKPTGHVWGLFGALSITLSAIAIFIVPMPITLVIVILFGCAESVTGLLLKNWPIIIAGFILTVVGAVAAMLLQGAEQLLLFTLAGILLMVTGVIVKSQYK
ncbi:MAG: hypothetical protein IK098_01385 [Bacteroidales bacterium]|nr:hypothetical protein [Bacteroidales bacterium]